MDYGKGLQGFDELVKRAQRFMDEFKPGDTDHYGILLAFDPHERTRDEGGGFAVTAHYRSRDAAGAWSWQHWAPGSNLEYVIDQNVLSSRPTLYVFIIAQAEKVAIWDAFNATFSWQKVEGSEESPFSAPEYTLPVAKVTPEPFEVDGVTYLDLKARLNPLLQNAGTFEWSASMDVPLEFSGVVDLPVGLSSPIKLLMTHKSGDTFDETMVGQTVSVGGTNVRVKAWHSQTELEIENVQRLHGLLDQSWSCRCTKKYTVDPRMIVGKMG